MLQKSGTTIGVNKNPLEGVRVLKGDAPIGTALAEEGQANEHRRQELLRDHFGRVLIFGMWVIACIWVLSAISLLLNFIFPDSWKWIRDPVSLVYLRTFVTGGAVAGTAGGVVRERLGLDRRRR